MMTCTFNDEKFANIAYEEALKSDLLSKHGSVAVQNGKVIARGHNSSRCYSNDGLLKNSCSTHAEVDVLRQILGNYCKPINLNNESKKSRRRRRRSFSSVNAFPVKKDLYCFLSKKHKPLCGT